MCVCRGHCFEEGRCGRSRCSLAVVKRPLTELAVAEVVRALVLPHRLGEPTVVPLRRCGPAGPCTARGRRMPKERPGGEAGWRAVPRRPSCARVVRHVSDVFEPRALQTLFSHKLLPKPRTAVLDAIRRARIRVSCLRFHFSGSLLLAGLTRYLDITRKEALPLLVFTAQPSSTRQVVYGRNYTLPLAGSWGGFLTPWSLVGKGNTLILAQCTRHVDLPQLVVIEA